MKLGEFVTLQRGHDLPMQSRKPGSIPIMGSFGVTGHHDMARASGPGVTIGRSGASFGVVSYSSKPFWPLNTALYVVDFHGNDERFAYYFLQQFDFTRYNSGSAQPSLNRNFIHPIPVRVPPLGEQRRIAHILGTLDDKIELNRRMNRTLEAIARTIFKSWFIDFDPVHAKAEGREPVGMDPETVALFPDSFQDSPLGKIPKGWEVRKVENLLSLSRESVKPLEHSSEQFDHFSIPAFAVGGPSRDVGETIRSSKYCVPPSAVLISKLNPHIPRVWLPQIGDGRRAVCSTEFLVCVPRSGVSREYLYCLLSSTAFLDRFAQMVTGTTGSHQRVRPTAFLNIDVVIPPQDVRDAFTRRARAMLYECAALLTESSELAVVRDALLPRLLSGKLEVVRSD